MEPKQKPRAINNELIVIRTLKNCTELSNNYKQKIVFRINDVFSTMKN